MGYTLVSAPGSEPITRAEAKLHMRLITDPADVTVHPEDDTVDDLIVAARQFAEQETQRSLITQTWRYTCDAFPCVIKLVKGPVSAIDSITYVDMAGATQTLASTEYATELTGTLARITPAFGKTWPPTLPQIGSVAVNFTAGYGAAAAVPQGLKRWMLLRIGALYENREEVGGDLKPLPFIDSLLDAYRIEVA